MSDWMVRGSYFEVCNCDAVCPCRSVGGRPGGPSTYDTCEFVLSWLIHSGRHGHLDLSGFGVVLAGWYTEREPGSPWRVALYVDHRAAASQRQSLADIFLGRAGGGTLRNFAAAIGEVLASGPATISLTHEQGEWAVTVDTRVEVRASQIVTLDEPVACGIPGLDRPGQEVVAEVNRVADGPLAWQFSGRCGFATDFEYCSDR